MIVQRFKGSVYGHAAMKVAVVQFGNGKLDSDNVVSDAKIVLTSTDDMNSVSSAIGSLQWERGFTNMAQALMKANNLLQTNSRKDAQSVVMVLTDGRPSFKLQTQKAVTDL